MRRGCSPWDVARTRPTADTLPEVASRWASCNSKNGMSLIRCGLAARRRECDNLCQGQSAKFCHFRPASTANEKRKPLIPNELTTNGLWHGDCRLVLATIERARPIGTTNPDGRQSKPSVVPLGHASGASADAARLPDVRARVRGATDKAGR